MIGSRVGSQVDTTYGGNMSDTPRDQPRPPDGMCTTCGHHSSWHWLPVPHSDWSCHNYAIGAEVSCPCEQFTGGLPTTETTNG